MKFFKFYYKMLLIKLSLFFSSMIFYSNGTSWSTWTLCSPQENCHQQTSLKCDKGKGIQCAPLVIK